MNISFDGFFEGNVQHHTFMRDQTKNKSLRSPLMGAQGLSLRVINGGR